MRQKHVPRARAKNRTVPVFNQSKKAGCSKQQATRFFEFYSNEELLVSRSPCPRHFKLVDFINPSNHNQYLHSILQHSNIMFYKYYLFSLVASLSQIQTTYAFSIFSSSSSSKVQSAQSLLTSLIDESQCFTTLTGASEFASACSPNILYEDCYEPQPLVGRFAVEEHLKKRVQQRTQRSSNASVRIDKISDGTKACGFAWTWTCDDLEGLRGTTFVELNDQNEIVYVREIPEPIFKPGDATLELLKAVTAGAEPKVFNEPLTVRKPKNANDVVKYLFLEVQGREVEESMKLFSEKIVYRDFNYEEVLRGKDEVQKFIEDFSFPGIEFRAQRFDDGVTSTCFTWEVVLMDAPDTVKGISFYELDPETKLITYVRDVPESAIKPPILGKLARQLRPGVGYVHIFF